jgi:chaperonin GroES
MFGQYSGSEITVDEETLLVMSEDEIVAVIEE